MKEFLLCKRFSKLNMSFCAIPNFDALEIVHSQAQKYLIQNILYYHNGEFRNYGFSDRDNSIESQELRKVISHMTVYRGTCLDFPCFNQTTIANHVIGVIDSLFKRINTDSEIFLDNITLYCLSGVKSVEWDDSSKKEIRDAILADKAPLLKMDLYVALPYNENILSEYRSSEDSVFLETFREEWGIVRPWRYVSVRNWIYLPRITVYGDEIYDLEVVGEYTRGIISQIKKDLFRGELNYDVIRKFYAYLRTVFYFSDKDIQPRRFQDQITFHKMRECKEDRVLKMLRNLQRFFEESPVSFVYSVLCDLRAQNHIKEIYSHIDPGFLQQFQQIIEYLLEEYGLSCDINVIEKYIESRLKEEIVITSEDIENTIF